jgi:hypothetical protein
MQKNKKIGVLFRVPQIILYICLIILIKPIFAEAGDGFYHTHRPACYERKLVPCTDHWRYVSATTRTQNCPPCGGMRESTYYSSIEYCPSRNFYHEHGGYYICKTCGSKNQVMGNFNGTWNDSVEKDVLKCTILEGALEAGATMEASTVNWTNDSVQVSLKLTGIAVGYQPGKLMYSFDGGASFQESSAFFVTQNSTVQGVVKDGLGRTIEKSITVENIDKTAPEIQRFYPERDNWSSGNLKLLVQASDSDSGISDAAYSFDQGLTYVSDNFLEVSTSGTYQVIVRDGAGNTSQTSVSVTKIVPVVTDQTDLEKDAIIEKKPTEQIIPKEKITVESKDSTKIEEKESIKPIKKTKQPDTVNPKETINKKDNENVNAIRAEEIMREIWSIRKQQEAEQAKLNEEQLKTKQVQNESTQENLQKRYELNQLEMVEYLKKDLEKKEAPKFNKKIVLFLLLPVAGSLMFLSLIFFLTFTGLLYGKNEKKEFVYLGRILFYRRKGQMSVYLPRIKYNKLGLKKLCLKPPKRVLKQAYGEVVVIGDEKDKISFEIKEQIFFQSPF